MPSCLAVPFHSLQRISMAARAAAIAAIAGAALPGGAASQALPDCSAVRPSEARQPAYSARTEPPRCEGFFERNVSQSFLELVSLRRAAPKDLALEANGRLVVRGHPHVDVQLTVQPLRSTPLYRMDAPLRRGTSLDWDARPMLQATNLRARDLGLLARAASPAGSTPAWVPVAVGAADDTTPALVVLRPSVGVSALSWRSYRPGSAPGPWQPAPGTPLFAWERVALVLPAASDGLAQHVDVHALDAQGQALPLLSFVVLGANDGKP